MKAFCCSGIYSKIRLYSTIFHHVFLSSFFVSSMGSWSMKPRNIFLRDVPLSTLQMLKMQRIIRDRAPFPHGQNET